MHEENKQKNNEIKIKESVFAKPWVQSVTGVVVILVLLSVFIVWRVLGNEIHIENSSIDAPIINLSSTTPGILNNIYVTPGQTVEANTPVAVVGNETIVSKVSGVILSVNHQEGQYFAPGVAVVTMINKEKERVVGKIDEDKGLKEVKVGQVATFTVDAFGSKKYTGVVDEISPMSDQSSVVFNISDKREVKQFDVKVRFDTTKYPELKEGMSAKITIYKK